MSTSPRKPKGAGTGRPTGPRKNTGPANTRPSSPRRAESPAELGTEIGTEIATEAGVARDVEAAPIGPAFRRSLTVFWVYTLLRFGLFGALFAIMWLLGAGGFIGAIIALALSVPLSWVLLARPRRAFAANIEQRVNARVVRKAEFDAQLAGVDDEVPDQDSGIAGADSGSA